LIQAAEKGNKKSTSTRPRSLPSAIKPQAAAAAARLIKMNLALASNGPFTMPPQPTANGNSIQAIKMLVDTFFSVCSRELISSSLNGGIDALLETQDDPSRAGVILRFATRALIYDVLRRLHAGEVIDPTSPLPGTDQGCLAVYSYDTVPSLYESAVSSATSRGLGFHDIVASLSISYVDLAGENCAMTSFCYRAQGALQLDTMPQQ